MRAATRDDLCIPLMYFWFLALVFVELPGESNERLDLSQNVSLPSGLFPRLLCALLLPKLFQLCLLPDFPALIYRTSPTEDKPGEERGWFSVALVVGMTGGQMALIAMKTAGSDPLLPKRDGK